jgi:hypothetical protein
LKEFSYPGQKLERVMKEKTPNLVEGRLGTPSLTPQESDGQAAGTSTNYGVGRLGITSDSSLEAPGQHADTPTSEELSSLAKARDVAAQAAAA